VSVVLSIDYLHRKLPRFMAPTRRHVAMAFRFATARVEYQPLGVIGIIATWNYPFPLAVMGLATAIAAGNRAMLKLSEFTPETNRLLAGMLADTVSEEQVAVVTGDAAGGAAFASLPFDHLLFTRSTGVGRAVMRAASGNLVPVTLELGGKSPAIVAPGRAHGRTAASIAFGKLANAGQTCIAPDYAMVHEHETKLFGAAYGRAVEALYPDGPASEDYTSIINDRHFGPAAAAHRRYTRQGGHGSPRWESGRRPPGAGPTHLHLCSSSARPTTWRSCRKRSSALSCRSSPTPQSRTLSRM
jgi:coniferyl-aldehyde dehydrogenase